MQWNDEIIGLWPTLMMRGQIVEPSVLSHFVDIGESQASATDDSIFTNEDAAIRHLRNIISSAVQAYFQHLEVSPAPGWRLQGRLERLAYGESRGLRNAPGAYLSGIFYIQTPKDTEPLHLRSDSHPGSLTLFDPRPGFNMLSIRNDPYSNQGLMAEPEPGLFLMWPAFVNCYRHPNLSRTTQLCVCFDVLPCDGDAAGTQSAPRWEGDLLDMWSTGLIKRRLPEHDRPNQELIRIIDEMERENPNLTTDFDVDRIRDSKHAAVDWLMSHIYQSVSGYFNQIGMKHPVSWEIRSWPNINRFGDYHSPHNHPWSYLSGTYYVQVPEADIDQDSHKDLDPACISFSDPRSGMNLIRFPQGSRSSPVFTVRPVPGALLIWPSTVYHFVHPNLSERKRYSISFNIHVQWQGHNS